MAANNTRDSAGGPYREAGAPYKDHGPPLSPHTREGGGRAARENMGRVHTAPKKATQSKILPPSILPYHANQGRANFIYIQYNKRNVGP